MDSGETTSEREALRATISKGFWGDQEEIAAAESALAAFFAYVEQLEAAVRNYQAKYGEAVADPLTELRLRLQRGE